MSLGHSPSIVTNGLILCLDAANTKSYPGTGTTWTDLSGNGYIGTLTNGPTFNSANNGFIVLDGVDDYISVNNPQLLNPGSASFSIDAWVYQKGNVAYNGVVEARGTSLHGFLYVLNYASTGQCSLFLNTTLDANQNIYTSTVSTFSDLLVWINICVTVNRSNQTITFYKNGIQQGSSVSITSGGTVDPSSDYKYWIGGDLGGPEANMNISSIKHYNRALSASEVVQNFNALRGRYSV